MASVTSVVPLFSDAGAQRTVLYRITNVASGDTIDVSSVGSFAFHRIQAAALISHALGVALVLSFVGTIIVLTCPGTLVADTVDLLVMGE